MASQPPLLWQAGLEIPLDEVLTVRLTEEWLCVRPLLYGEAGMRSKETRRFHLGLLHAAKLRQACGYDSLRSRRRSLVPHRFDRVFVSACRILYESEIPVVPAGRVWIETKRLAHVVDGLDGAPLVDLDLPQDHPGVGIVRIDFKGLRQFCCPC